MRGNQEFSKVRPPYRIARTTQMNKPGFGTLRLVSAWWWPNRLTAIWFSPATEGAGWTRVPLEAGDEILTAGSWEQVMAIARRA